MKVLHVIHRYPPAIGGAEVWLREIARRLAGQHGHKLEIHTLALHEEDEYWRHYPPEDLMGAYGTHGLDDGVEVVRHRASIPTPWHRWDRVFRFIHKRLGWYLYGPHSMTLYRGLSAAIRDADLVHLHTHPFPHILFGLHLCRRIGRPVVVTPHFHPAAPVHLARHSIRALKMADRIFTVTEFERDALVGHGLPVERMVVTGNGVDLEHYRALAQTASGAGDRPDLGRTPGTKRICFLGRKVDYKGVDLLIEATRRVRESRPAELVLVGPGTDWFDRHVASLPDEDRRWIHDLGVVSEVDKVAALRSCDLLVQPSPHEAFGIVFLEAWACGLPVVGAESGAIPSVVERGGLVFRPGDVDSLAAAIGRLIDEPDTAAACARRGAERVEQEFTWDRLADKVHDAYREVRPRPRRVLVVSSIYPPKSFGGAEVMAREGAVGLARRGYEVRVFANYRDKELPRWQASQHHDEGTLVHYHSIRFEDTTPGRTRHYRSPESEAAFERVLAEWRPEVVHFHNIQTLSPRLIDIAEDAGIPTVMTLHDYLPVCYRQTRLLDDGSECRRNGHACLACRAELIDAPEVGMLERNAAMRASIDRLRLLIAPARYITERMIEEALPRERFRHHPYGIDLEHFQRVARARAPRRPVRFGFLGYIGRHKGVFVLGEAALKLRGEFQLLVYGEGWEQPELAELVEPLKGKVEFRGPCPHERIDEAFAEVDVLVLPALWPDNFPVSILEALASGTVVVASAMGGMPEQVTPDVNGFLVPPGDPSALAQVLQRLVDDPELVPRLSQGALRSSEAYARDRYLDQLEELYREAFHSLPSSGRSRPFVVHSGSHSDRGAADLYRALERLSHEGLDVEVLSLRNARDLDIEQAWAVLLCPGATDSVELVLRAAAYDRSLLARADDARSQALLERVGGGTSWSDPDDLAARLKVLTAAPPARVRRIAADSYVARMLREAATDA